MLLCCRNECMFYGADDSWFLSCYFLFFQVEETIADLTPRRVASKLVVRKRPRPSQYDGQSVQVEVADVVLQLIPMLHIDVQECKWGLHLWNRQ